MELILKIAGLKGGYGGNEIVRGISFDVRAGDFLGIIGPNGSGKTTLLRLISRILRPSAGSVLFCGREVFALDAKEFSRRVAFVSQDTHAAFPFTVSETVLMGRIPHLKRLQAESKKDHAIAESSMEMTDTLRLKDALITELSAGERQRVLIARALTQEPDVILLDEPTAHLDIGHQVQVLDLIKKLNRTGKLTVVIVLHDLNLAGAYCNRIVLMNEGAIFSSGSPQDVLTYQNIETVYKTVVVVKENPLTKRPYVFVVPGENK